MAALTLALAATEAGAVTLTYDNPVIQIAPGESIPIGVTLSLDSVDAALVTDDNGQQYDTGVVPPLLVHSLGVWQQLQGFFGSPAGYFSAFTSFAGTSPNPFADLTLAPGGSVHLVLGTINTQTELPVGTYTTDIGIDNGCIGTICMINPFGVPSFADAGMLTINVVPEPMSAALLSAVAVIGMVRRRATA